jgi:pimeloyl-ACP methyl ester carboxylesterase
MQTQSTSLKAIRAGFQMISRTAPALAAAVGEKLMFRTTRRPPPAWERDLAARARSFQIDTRRGSLAAWSWGEGPKTVLLVHGWNGRGTQLGEVVEPLVRDGYRVVTFDAPGHGETSGSRSSLVHFADAIEDVIDAIRPVFGSIHAVVAHSMGGAATVVAMSRFQKRPETEIDRALRDTLPVERFVFVSPPIDVRDFVTGFSHAVALGPESELLLGERIQAHFAVGFDELYAPDLARELSGPLLVIHDTNDREVPLARGERLAESWPGAELWVTEGLGHTRILRDPAVIQRIVEFVCN